MIQTQVVLGRVWRVDQKETDEIRNTCASPDKHKLKYLHTTRHGAKK